MSEEVLSPDKITELKLEFARFDKDGTGLIRLDQLILFLRCIGLNPSKSDSNECLRRCESENKMVDFSMVSNIVQSMGWDRSAEQKALVEAFAEFDPENSGYISETALRKNLSSLGDDQLTKDDIDTLILLQEKRDDGKIDYRSLTAVLSGNT